MSVNQVVKVWQQFLQSIHCWGHFSSKNVKQQAAPVAEWLRHIPHNCTVYSLTPNQGTFVACPTAVSPHVSCLFTLWYSNKGKKPRNNNLKWKDTHWLVLAWVWEFAALYKFYSIVHVISLGLGLLVTQNKQLNDVSLNSGKSFVAFYLFIYFCLW